MKRTLSLLLAVILALGAIFSLASCGEKSFTVAIPNDTTNEARALLLLEAQGWIKLKDGAGITATPRDVVENPYGLTFKEVEAAQLPGILQDVDYAVINSNYAIDAGINPVADSLAIEGSYSAYANILAVKEGNQDTDKIKALRAALESAQVAAFIESQYAGSVVSVVSAKTDGYDASVDYGALDGVSISVAASPTPHAEILAIEEAAKKRGSWQARFRRCRAPLPQRTERRPRYAPHQVNARCRCFPRCRPYL